MATCNYSCPVGQLLAPARATSHVSLSPVLPLPEERKATFLDKHRLSYRPGARSGRARMPVVGSSPGGDGIVAPGGDGVEDGISLGTMKLPRNTDLARFESLLFQWANSLCQGANLPLPVPLKVDKIPGGTRLGFITIGDGKTEVTVYIDCLVFPATESSGPIFRAIRNGPRKDSTPPGEPRIMRSLLQALQKSVEIASV